MGSNREETATFQPGMEDQPGIEQRFTESFAACDALGQFAREHRPRAGFGTTPILTWTLARQGRPCAGLPLHARE